MSKTMLLVFENRELTVDYARRMQSLFPFDIIEANKKVFELEWNKDYIVLIDKVELEKTPLSTLVAKLREESCSVVFMEHPNTDKGLEAMYNIVSGFYEKTVLFSMSESLGGVTELTDHLIELMLG